MICMKNAKVLQIFQVLTFIRCLLVLESFSILSLLCYPILQQQLKIFIDYYYMFIFHPVQYISAAVFFKSLLNDRLFWFFFFLIVFDLPVLFIGQFFQHMFFLIQCKTHHDKAISLYISQQKTVKYICFTIQVLNRFYDNCNMTHIICMPGTFM